LFKKKSELALTLVVRSCAAADPQVNKPVVLLERINTGVAPELTVSEYLYCQTNANLAEFEAQSAEDNEAIVHAIVRLHEVAAISDRRVILSGPDPQSAT
jgi:hypothetical protein